MSASALFNAVAIKPLTNQIDVLRTEFGDEIVKFAMVSSALDFAMVRNVVQSLGGTVTAETIVNSAVIAEVPARYPTTQCRK